MVNDDWSLKGRKFLGYDSEGKVFSSALEKGKLQEMYNEDDIETLRQKLIMDLRLVPPQIRKDTEKVDFSYELGRTDGLREAVKIINKRFGVEE